MRAAGSILEPVAVNNIASIYLGNNGTAFRPARAIGGLSC